MTPLADLTGQTFGTREKAHTTTASLDRIDSSKGYESGNLQWIHKKIQPMKMAMSESEFLAWCIAVLQHQRPELMNP